MAARTDTRTSKACTYTYRSPTTRKSRATRSAWRFRFTDTRNLVALDRGTSGRGDGLSPPSQRRRGRVPADRGAGPRSMRRTRRVPPQRAATDVRCDLNPRSRALDAARMARGAIARSQCHAIQIRVLDIQECPRMSIGIAALLVDLVQASGEVRLPASQAMGLPTGTLADRCIRDAECDSLDHGASLGAFGMRRQRCLAGDLWECIGERLRSIGSPCSVCSVQRHPHPDSRTARASPACTGRLSPRPQAPARDLRAALHGARCGDCLELIGATACATLPLIP